MTLQNNEFWNDFIDIYQQHDELWNVRSEKYKNRQLRNKAWITLVDKLKEIDNEATVDVARKRINSMRSSYRREIQKVRKSEKSGAGADDIYVPTLWYFEKLSFLKDHEIQSEGISSIDLEIDTSDGEHSMVDVPPKQKRRKPEEDRNVFLRKAVEHLHGISNKSKERDEADVFAESWAVSYRKLAQDQQIFAKKAIDDILIQGMLGRLTITSFQPSFEQQIPTMRSSTPSTTLLAHSSPEISRSLVSPYLQSGQTNISYMPKPVPSFTVLSIPSPSSQSSDFSSVQIPTPSPTSPGENANIKNISNEVVTISQEDVNTTNSNENIYKTVYDLLKDKEFK